MHIRIKEQKTRAKNMPIFDMPSIKFLTMSDVSAGLAAAILDVVGVQGLGKMMPATFFAILISVLSRIMGTMVNGTVGTGGMLFPIPGVTSESSNLLSVAMYNAILAYMQKRPKVKAMVLGMSVDSVGYSLMTNLLPYINVDQGIKDPALLEYKFK